MHTYTARVEVNGRTRMETLEAESWVKVWTDLIERYGPNSKIQVSQFFYLVEFNGRRFACGEAEYAAMGRTAKIVDGPIMAACWLEAKERFGLPLTEIQKDLLKTRRELAGR